MAQNIKERIDAYPLTHVDCIEKAICCILNEYDEAWACVYLMYNNLSRCFSLEQKIESEMGVLEYLCDEGILPVEFHVSKVMEKSVAKEAEKLLETGALCLVPANLCELFYSKHFHNSDWPHLFFIRKCDKDERLLYIMDSCQKVDNEEIFSPFVMEYDKLDKIYKSYCHTFPKNMMYREADVFYYLNLDSQKEKAVNLAALSQNLLEQVAEFFEGQKEKQLLDSLLKNQTSYTKETCNNIDSFLGDKKIKFRQIIKRKSVFYTEIIYSLFSSNDEFLEQFKQQLTGLATSWNSFYHAMISGMLRKQTGNLMDKLEAVVVKEKDLLNDMLHSLEKCQTEMDNKSGWILEHDEPGEILIKENHIYVQTKKNHNAWNKDEALEVICINQNGKVFEDIFQIKVNVKSSSRQNNYHAGIVIKTKDERMYVWGCYNEECLRLSDIGVKVDMKDFFISNLLDLRLSAIVNNQTLYFVAENDAGERKEACLENIVPFIKKIGVILKTWENDSQEEVKAEFEVIESV